MFANMLDIFPMVSGIGVSYKTLERLYSDEEVVLAIHNLHTLMLKKNNVSGSRSTGDGTGYSLTVKKNYASYAQKMKNNAMEEHLDMAKRLIKHMFFQNKTNLKKIGKNRDAVVKLTEGNTGREMSK